MITTQAGLRVTVLCALASLCAGGGCAVNDANTGLANVHTVCPGVLVRGAQPSERGFRTLRDEYGERTVVNLHDSTAKTEGKVVESLGMHYIAIPSDAFHPDSEKVLQFVKTVRDASATPGGGAVYVHCRQGMDRTGYAVAAYRILVDGWDADRAMAELRSIQVFPHAMLFPGIEPFVRGVYRNREEWHQKLSPPAATATVVSAAAPAR
jgi:protein tyrosine/serine phosphatase